MTANLDGLVWLFCSLAPLLILQRRLHREIQAVFFLITRRLDMAITLFSILFFPGVLLHEGSHYLMAHLLGVQTGRFSLIPRPLGDGKLQLGYVETVSADWLREALVGMAPLITGGLFVAYAGLYRLNIISLGQALLAGNLQIFLQSVRSLVAQPDFWLWFYLTLVVSSTMLPSESDRRAWLPLGLILLGLFGISLVAGAGPWLYQNLAAPMNQILRSISLVFVISAVLHLLLLPFVWLIRSLLARLLGLEVVI
jgi:hypothetical protein